MIPYTSALSPAIDSTAPSGSSGAWIFSRDRGMRKKPATSATTTTATLIRKIEPHQKCSSSAPLTTPPMATPTPAKPAQIAIARGRSLGGNTWARIDSVAGITNAAPTPMTARAPITAPDGARQRREQRCRAEHDQPAVEREPSAVAVTQRTGGEQQAGEHQGVGVDDPLQAARPGVEAPRPGWATPR